MFVRVTVFCTMNAVFVRIDHVMSLAATFIPSSESLSVLQPSYGEDITLGNVLIPQRHPSKQY